MGVLTHLDSYKNNKALRKRKKLLKHRFWTEIYPGAKLFYLSGMVHGEYNRMEVHNLGRFISVMKYRPLTWSSSHPYVIGKVFEGKSVPISQYTNSYYLCSDLSVALLFLRRLFIPLERTTTAQAARV